MLHYLCVFVALSAVHQVVLGQTCIDFNSSCQQDNQCAFVFTKPRQEGESCPQNVDLVDVDQMMQTIRVLDSAVETVASTIAILNHTVSFQIERGRQELLNSGDPCNPNPCNSGTCSASSDPSKATRFVCHCPLCHSGDTCEISTDPCDCSPCGNGATCIPTADCNSLDCMCTRCYTGRNCLVEMPTDLCSSNPCENNGICIENSCDFTCNCATGWTGTHCETVFDPCNPNPCGNGGACTTSDDSSSTAGYVCQCPQCYSGNNCEISHINLCGCNMCLHDGICLPTHDCTDYVCLCKSCYTGKDCQTTLLIPDPCSLNPCQYNGTCQAGLCTDYTCHCDLCHYGTDCEMSLQLDPCDSNPCMNGGSCLKVSCVEFQCSCAEGWTGSRCETSAQGKKKRGADRNKVDKRPYYQVPGND